MIKQALAVLRNGGVLAYPTEYCFGLGCDPKNKQAVARILGIKQREQAQGLILVAANTDQVQEYGQLQSLARAADIQKSWPGPNTWLLPITATTPDWIHGQHNSVAMRVSEHPVVTELCQQFGGAIVSTSANRHGAEALTTAAAVKQEMGNDVDYVIDAAVLSEEQSASSIYDALTGQQLR